MKKITFVVALFLVMFFLGCNSDVTDKNSETIVLPMPSSNGPDAAPTVNGPTSTDNPSESSDAPQAMTEKEDVTYTLQPKN